MPVRKLRGVTCHMASHSVTSCHPTQVNAPRLNPSQSFAALYQYINTRYCMLCLLCFVHTLLMTLYWTCFILYDLWASIKGYLTWLGVATPGRGRDVESQCMVRPWGSAELASPADMLFLLSSRASDFSLAAARLQGSLTILWISVHDRQHKQPYYFVLCVPCDTTFIIIITIGLLLEWSPVYCILLSSVIRKMTTKQTNLSLFDDIVLDTPQSHQGGLATFFLIDSVEPFAPFHLSLQHQNISFIIHCVVLYVGLYSLHHKYARNSRHSSSRCDISCRICKPCTYITVTHVHAFYVLAFYTRTTNMQHQVDLDMKLSREIDLILALKRIQSIDQKQRWKWVIFRDPWPMWPITQLTHDPHDPWRTTHGHYPYAWDKEGAWHGGTGQPSRSSEQKIVGHNYRVAQKIWHHFFCTY